MNNKCIMLAIVTSFTLMGCRENAEEPELASKTVTPRHDIACVKTMPKRSVATAQTVRAPIERSEPISTSNPTVAIQKLSEELKNFGDVGELTANRALQLIETHLGSTTFSEAFSGLSDLMVSSDAEGRIAALNVLSILKGEWCATMDTADDADANMVVQDEVAQETESSADEEGSADVARNPESENDGNDDIEQRAVYTMMTLGLQDESSSVRDAAYETLMTLPEEERAALSLQLMGNGDAALKERLLSSCAGDDSEFARGVSFHGLDAEESSVRALAGENVKSLFGRSFASSDEAFAWYEQKISVGE